MSDAEPKCPVCGIEFSNHLGLIGTCQRNKDLSAELLSVQAQLGLARRALQTVEKVAHYDQDRRQYAIPELVLYSLKEYAALATLLEERVKNRPN